MPLFNVYNKWTISLKKANGVHLWDKNENVYLDFYGGHGVISIGHNHPYWKNAITTQLDKISYYSNAVHIEEQQQLAHSFSSISNYPEYNLFLCNSGAEANENALKLASFYNKRSEIIALKKGFHGRTVGALSCTDNPNIQSQFNKQL